MKKIFFLIIPLLIVLAAGCGGGGNSADEIIKDDIQTDDGTNQFGVSDDSEITDDDTTTTEPSAKITSTAARPIKITGTITKAITAGVAYTKTIKASGGVGKLTWSELKEDEDGDSPGEWLEAAQDGTNFVLKAEAPKVGVWKFITEVCDESEEPVCATKKFTLKVKDTFLVEAYQEGSSAGIEDTEKFTQALPLVVPLGKKLNFKVKSSISGREYKWDTSEDEDELKLTPASGGLTATLAVVAGKEGYVFRNVSVAVTDDLGSKTKVEISYLKFEKDLCTTAFELMQETSVVGAEKIATFKIVNGKGPFEIVAAETKCLGKELPMATDEYVEPADQARYTSACVWSALDQTKKEVTAKLSAGFVPPTSNVRGYRVIARLAVRDTSCSVKKSQDSELGASQSSTSQVKGFVLELFNGNNLTGDSKTIDAETSYGMTVLYQKGQEDRLTSELAKRAMKNIFEDSSVSQASQWVVFDAPLGEDFIAKANSYKLSVLGAATNYDECRGFAQRAKEYDDIDPNTPGEQPGAWPTLYAFMQIMGVKVDLTAITVDGKTDDDWKYWVAWEKGSNGRSNGNLVIKDDSLSNTIGCDLDERPAREDPYGNSINDPACIDGSMDSAGTYGYSMSFSFHRVFVACKKR